MDDLTPARAASASGLDAFFGLTARGTTVRREVLAGATTFVTMAYIVFVNPAILDDFTEAVPAFLTLTVMPFTYSITNGIGAGFVAFVVLKLATGRLRHVHPLMAGAAAAFVVYFALA